MAYAGIEITDTDSLVAAADLIEDVETWGTCEECRGSRSIVDYSPGLGYIEIECPACDGQGSVLDLGDDFDPEPPTPAAPAVLSCRECAGSGTRRYSVGFGLSDWVEESCTWCAGTGAQAAPLPVCPACTGTGEATHAAFLGVACWYCNGSGADGFATVPPAASIPFDRAEHCRRIGSYGGVATATTHGTHHMRVIGQTGARMTIARHGLDYWRGIVAAKGWTEARRPDLLSDLAAGRALADLDRAA
jgi:DnaJ-class molecular chaperone